MLVQGLIINYGSVINEKLQCFWDPKRKLSIEFPNQNENGSVLLDNFIELCGEKLKNDVYFHNGYIFKFFNLNQKGKQDFSENIEFLENNPLVTPKLIGYDSKRRIIITKYVRYMNLLELSKTKKKFDKKKFEDDLKETLKKCGKNSFRSDIANISNIGYNGKDFIIFEQTGVETNFYNDQETFINMFVNALNERSVDYKKLFSKKKKKIIILKSKEGGEFKITDEDAEYSETIKKFLDDSNNNIIEFPYITSKTLSLITEYMKEKNEYPDFELSEIKNIMDALNYLDAPELLNFFAGQLLVKKSKLISNNIFSQNRNLFINNRKRNYIIINVDNDDDDVYVYNDNFVEILRQDNINYLKTLLNVENLEGFIKLINEKYEEDVFQQEIVLEKKLIQKILKDPNNFF